MFPILNCDHKMNIFHDNSMGVYKLKAPFKHPHPLKILTMVIFAEGIIGGFNDLCVFSYLFPEKNSITFINRKVILIHVLLCIEL